MFRLNGPSLTALLCSVLERKVGEGEDGFHEDPIVNSPKDRVNKELTLGSKEKLLEIKS